MIDVKAFRKRLLMTQPQLAKALRTTERTVRRWEREHRQPRRIFRERMQELSVLPVATL